MEKQKRLNLTMPPSTMEMLENLKRRTGAASITEVIRRSIALYSSIAPDLDAECELYLRDTSRQREIQIKVI